MGARLLHDHLKPRNVWISDPTWINHHVIWEVFKDVNRRVYPYIKEDCASIDFENMIYILENKAERNDIIILHACAHNPTGLDPTQEQWKTISELCKRKKIFPFFDVAYQGFASGDPNRDSWAVRHFVDEGLEMCAAQSFSKNFGLYGERVGCLHVILAQPGHRELVIGQLCHYQRGHISTPPSHGARIVSAILNSEELYQEWLNDLRVMTRRIENVRLNFVKALIEKGATRNWNCLLKQVCFWPNIL